MQLTGEYQAVTAPSTRRSDAGGAVRLFHWQPEAAHGDGLPQRRILHYGYDGNALDAAIGRVDYLADDNGSGAAATPHLVDYTYQGLNTFIGQADGDGVVETTTLDNYGRIADMNYVNSGQRQHRPLCLWLRRRRQRALQAERQADGSNFSELYSYDSLNRLTTFARGTLNSDNTAIATPNTLAGSAQSLELSTPLATRRP